MSAAAVTPPETEEDVETAAATAAAVSLSLAALECFDLKG